MKVLEKIANAEWWVENSYKAAGKRFNKMSEVVKSMSDKLRAKFKK